VFDYSFGSCCVADRDMAKIHKKVGTRNMTKKRNKYGRVDHRDRLDAGSGFW